jgi:hypothetical protein
MIRLRRTSLLLAFLVVGCARSRPEPVFDCRVAAAPLVDDLKAHGGDPGRILKPTSLEDLRRMGEGRHLFVVLEDGHLAISPVADGASPNGYAHAVLGGGRAALSAGGLRVDWKGASPSTVTVDQDSPSYCPSASSLGAALSELERIGVPGAALRVENRPPACVGAPPPQEPPARYGALMAEVGMRFERLGRAATARRRELADFELGEMGEIFDEDLPRAEPPRESQGVNLAGVAQAFQQTNLPDLKQALASKDPKAFPRAFARAAEACNGCHHASGHHFVEVPTEPGRSVPRLDPVP